MHEMPYQTITSVACGFGFLDLARQFGKRQPIQFAMQEGDHFICLTLLPAL